MIKQYRLAMPKQIVLVITSKKIYTFTNDEMSSSQNIENLLGTVKSTTSDQLLIKMIYKDLRIEPDFDGEDSDDEEDFEAKTKAKFNKIKEVLF